MTEIVTTVQQFTEYLEELGRSPNTVRAYTQDVTAFADWFQETTGEVLDPKVVLSRDIQAYKHSLVEARKSPTTTNRRIMGLRKFFKWAKMNGLTPDSPFDVLENVTVREQKGTAPRWLERKEQLALLRAVRKSANLRDMAVIQTLLGTGARAAELVTIRVDDLTLQKRKGWVHVIGKGVKERDVPFGNQTCQALANYLDREREQSASNALFLGQRGPLTYQGVVYIVKKYAEQTKITHCSPHTLRHCFGKNHIDAGTPLQQLKVMMVHENIASTLLYTMPSKADLERSASRVEGDI